MIRSFSTAITSDPTFTRRSAAAQLLYFRLYMHPGNHLCGLFMYGADHMAVDLKATPQLAAEALEELASYGFAQVDTSLDLVWIPEMVKLIGDVSAPRHPIGSAIVKYLRGLSIRQSTLIARVASTLRLTLGPTLVDTLSTRDLSVSVSDPVSESGSEQSKTLARAASPPMQAVSSGQSGEPEVNQSPPSPKTPCSIQGSRPQESPVPLAAQAGLPGLVPAAPPECPAKRPKQALVARKDAPPTRKTWEAYANAYAQRYGVMPTPNARVNGQLAQLVKDMGAEDAPKIAEFYLARNASFYVTQHHPIGLLLRDAQGLRTEMISGRTANVQSARKEELTEANPAAALLADLRRKKP